MTSYLAALVPAKTREDFFKYLQSSRDQPPNPSLKSKLQSFFSQNELALCTIQRILNWDNPSVSALAFLGTLIAAWNLITFYRPLGVFFSALFALWVYAVLKYDVWPVISVPLTEEELQERKEQAEWVTLDQGVLTAPEMSRLSVRVIRDAKGFLAWLMHTRRRQPYMYVVVLGLPLSVMFTLGSLLSGQTLVYTAIFCAFVIPAVVNHADDILGMDIRSAFASEEQEGEGSKKGKKTKGEKKKKS
ncbi:unnamed protein product [Cyprideis torosa]|uniref:Uncharacterized protein n=1 Tax=Cyprideis torosa TaxID=163714 RepID=A0A7R8ZRN6_9CRUS|nr:unnamed protein product [Cyprideis torosa]CAG0894429.1 unnamed protein product [Cyprideis torosa]